MDILTMSLRNYNYFDHKLDLFVINNYFYFINNYVSGIFITIFIIERFGRKKTMAVQFVAYAICCCFLVVCTEKYVSNNFCNVFYTYFICCRRAFLTVMLFLARGIIAGVFQAAYVYTPEVYPTSLRAVGVGSCSAMARLGAMVTPYVAQVHFQKLTICSPKY